MRAIALANLIGWWFPIAIHDTVGRSALYLDKRRLKE
jgi:hypothetical protein